MVWHLIGIVLLVGADPGKIDLIEKKYPDGAMNFTTEVIYDNRGRDPAW